MDALNYVVFGVYIAAMVGIAVYTSRKNKTVNDFLLAGRGMGGWMTAFAYGTTYFSAVIFVGYAGTQGKAYGLAALWIGIGNAIIGSLVPWLLFAKRTRKMTAVSRAKTMPELFEARYGSKWIKLVSAILIFALLIPYSASVYTGLGYMFELIFGMKVWIVVLIMAAITALYLTFGGYYATLLSDFFQGIVMLAGVVIMVFCVYFHEKVGGFAQGFSNLIADKLGFFPSGSANSVYVLVMLVLLTSIGSWAVPQIVTKFSAVKNEKAVKKATWVSTGFALIVGVGAYLTGCVARYILTDFSNIPGEKIMPTLLYDALPAGLLGLIAVLLLSASMSTLSSLTLCSSSAVAVDIFKGYIKKDASDKSIKRFLNILCAIFVAVSAVIAIWQPGSIITLMSLSWGTLSGCFIGPYILGLYSKKMTKAGAFASIIGGVLLTAVLYAISLTVPAAKPWLPAPAIGVYAMCFSMLITPLVSVLTQKHKPSQDTLDKMFGSLDMTVEEIDKKEAEQAVTENN